MDEIFSQIPILGHFPLQSLLTISCCSHRHNYLVHETIKQMDSVVWQKGIRHLWTQCHRVSKHIHHHLSQMTQQSPTPKTGERLSYLSETLKQFDDFYHGHLYNPSDLSKHDVINIDGVLENEERLIYLKLLVSLHRHLKFLDDVLNHFELIAKIDYHEMVIHYLLLEFQALLPIREEKNHQRDPMNSINPDFSIKNPLACLKTFPNAQDHWHQLWGSVIYVSFSQFMSQYVPTFWGHHSHRKLDRMIQWSLDFAHDGLVTTYRLYCFLTQFDGPDHQVDRPGDYLAQMIEQLPTGFLAHVNHCYSGQLLLKYCHFLSENKPVVVWRFSHSYPTVLSFDVYLPQKRRISSYRHLNNQLSIVDMIHQIVHDCLFLPLELQEDDGSERNRISYHIWSPYSRQEDPA